MLSLKFLIWLKFCLYSITEIIKIFILKRTFYIRLYRLFKNDVIYRD